MNKLKSVVDTLFSLNHHTATLDEINKGNTRNKNVNLEQTTRWKNKYILNTNSILSETFDFEEIAETFVRFYFSEVA